MGKGFNSAKNKQSELAKKMALAKKQQQMDTASVEDELVDDDDESTQKDKDHLLFAQLLAQSQPVRSERVFTQSESRISEETKTHKVKAKDLKRKRRVAKESTKKKSMYMTSRFFELCLAWTNKALLGCADMMKEMDTEAPLQEGDVAQRRHFENLVSLETSQPLGPMGAAQLVPWVPPYLADYLVVLADPRRQSGDLRQTIQYLISNLTPEILSQVIVITADPNEETKK